MATTTTTPTLPEAPPTESEEERRQRQIEKNQPAIALIESLLAETDPEAIREQRETLEYLMRALDEHRTHRKLFS